MSIICSRIDRTLARLATRGRGLGDDQRAAAHVARCRRCRAAWDDYCATASRLAGALEAPPSSDRFVHAVWARIEADARPREAARPRGALAPAMVLAAAGCAAALTWVALRPRTSPESSRDVRAGAVASTRTVGPRIARTTMPPVITKRTGAEPARTEPKRLAPAKRRALAKARDVSPRVRVIIRPVRRLASATPGAGGQGTGQTSAGSTRTTTWLEVARYYEQQSDQWSAAHAYRRASEQASDPSLHYAAGQASERAGDVTAAIEDYARYLEAASPPPVDRNGQSDRRKGDLLELERRPV